MPQTVWKRNTVSIQEYIEEEFDEEPDIRRNIYKPSNLVLCFAFLIWASIYSGGLVLIDMFWSVPSLSMVYILIISAGLSLLNVLYLVKKEFYLIADDKIVKFSKTLICPTEPNTQKSLFESSVGVKQQRGEEAVILNRVDFENVQEVKENEDTFKLVSSKNVEVGVLFDHSEVDIDGVERFVEINDEEIYEDIKPNIIAARL